MIKLRLKRYGKKREVSYRIVAAQSTTRRDGRPLAELGFYNPRTDETRLNVPAILDWISKGAQPTETVRSILRRENVFATASSEPVSEPVSEQVSG
ncbi:30S ribosomal protein S16 [Phormidesmis sp. 146-35]